MNLHIRWMIRRDMEEVLAIEALSHEQPWAEEEFLRVLRQRNCIGNIVEHGKRVLGFMVYELRTRKLHLLNFAVHPAWRRRGIGSELVGKLASKMCSHRHRMATLDVRETNLGAQLFFQSKGFVATGIRHNFYEHEDAIAMTLDLAIKETTPEEKP